MADITRLGRAQLAEVGAAALSVRSVARELGVVSSAVYRYVASRDDLLTLLVVDAYTELAEVVETAVGRRRGDHRARFVAAAASVRTWALAEPSRYALLYGSPVPGYAAPAEQTLEPGTRVILAVTGVVLDAWRAGELADPGGADTLPATLRRDLARISEETRFAVPEPLVARALLAWSAIFGLVSLEVFGQYGADTFTRPGQLFDHQVALVATMAGWPRE